MESLPKEMAGFWKEEIVKKSEQLIGDARNWSILRNRLKRLAGSKETMNSACPTQTDKRQVKRACMLAYTFYESDNRVRRYAESLVRQGYHVDAVTLGDNGQLRCGSLNGVRVIRIQKRVRNEKNKFTYLYRLLNFFIRSALFVSKQHLWRRYDLIHVHSVPDFEVFATLFAKIAGAKIILDIHDIVPEFYASKFNASNKSRIFRALVFAEKASIAFSDHVIISNHIWEKTLNLRSARKGKCTTIMNYPDPSIFFPRLRTRTDSKFVVVYPGTLNWHQGVDIAVKAFAHMKNAVPEAEFHIYGDGPAKADIEQLVGDLGLQDRVFLHGRVPSEKIAETMADADLGVIPKRNDSFGGNAFSTKILEFMALGIPVVVAATQIDRHYFNDSIVRFFEPENIESLSIAIEELNRKKELRGRLALNAMAFVKDYTWDKKEKEYFALVNRLLGKKAN